MTCAFCSEPIKGSTELVRHRCPARHKPSTKPTTKPRQSTETVEHKRRLHAERQRRYIARHPKPKKGRRLIDVAQVAAMREDGYLLREIADATGFTTRTVWNALRRSA